MDTLAPEYQPDTCKTKVTAVVVLIIGNIICYGAHDQSLVRTRLAKRIPNISFVSNRAASRPATPSQYWLWDQLSANHLVASFVLTDTGILLLRACEVSFFVLTLALEGSTGDGFGRRPWQWWTFFTNWTFCLFGVWSVLGLVITTKHVQALVESARPSQNKRPFAELQWTWLTKAYCIIAEVNAGATLFLSIFYWALLYDGGSVPIDNALKHGLNNLVILADFVLMRMPVASYHFQWQLWYGSVFLVFMWVYHGLSARWVYGILNWEKPLAVVLYLFLPLFTFAGFAAWIGVAWAREYLGRRYPHLCRGNASFSADAEAGTAEVEGLTDSRDPEMEMYGH